MKLLAPRRLIVGAIAALLLAAVPAVSGGPSAFACSASPCTGTQTTQVNVNGVLTVSAATSTLNFGNAAPGSTTGSTAVGELDYNNTLGSGNSWSVTVASTDMVASPAPATCTPAGGCISWTGLNFAPGSTFATGQTGQTCTGNATTGMTAGAAGPFASGTDTTPGTTFSPPVTVMSGAASTDQGCFHQTGSNATLTLPTGLPSGKFYLGTFQYTITG
jgi:hypothetical protein